MLFALRVVGIALAAFGLLWSLQGFGIVTWPRDSFMLGQRQWGLIGVALAALGAALLWVSSRRRPPD